MRLFSPRLCVGIWLSAVVFMLGLSAVDSACKRGWISINSNKDNSGKDSCFKLYNFRLSFTSAAQYCKNRGGYLARDTSTNIHKTLYTYVQAANKGRSPRRSYWIGITDNNLNGGAWYWSFGSRISSPTFWAYNRTPRAIKFKRDCGYMYYYTGKWRTTTFCSNTNLFICQMDASAVSGTTVMPKKMKCPLNWVAYEPGNTCIYLSRYSKKYSDARSYCQSLSGDLIKLDKRIAGFVNNLISKNRGTYYIGLTDMGTEKKFVWNYETTATTYTNWDRNQPDNYGKGEDCVTIRPYSYKWNDIACSGRNRYICQGPPVNLPTGSSSCDIGWTPYPQGRTCLYVSISQTTFYGARQTCRSRRGDLVKITDATMNSFVFALIKKGKGSYFLIGLTDRIKERHFVWNDEKTEAKYLNWANNQPNNLGRGEDCAALHPSVSNGKWMDVRCSTKNYHFVCQKPFNNVKKITVGPPQSKCPTGWTAYSKGKTCLRRYSTRLSYTSARSSCKRQGSDLVKISDKYMNNYIGSLIRGKGDHFIGLHDRTTEKSFKWNDERTETTYANWAYREPNNYGRNGEDCVVMKSYGTYQWNDLACTTKIKYICQKPSTGYIPLTTPSPPKITPTQCPSGWTYYAFGKTCLRIFYPLKTKTNARLDCKRQKGDLVKIANKEMNAFITNMMPKGSASYIGLHDMRTENYFTWNDERYRAGYVNWAKGEPNNYRDKEDCVVIRSSDGTWNDDSCAKRRDYICQRYAYSAVQPTTAIPKTTPSYNCGSGWEEDKSSHFCYQFHKTRLSWRNARRACQSKGGSLASIGSSEQQSYLTGRTRDALKSSIYWIGATDIGREGGYRWTDRTPFAFINWADRQPNNLNNQDCVGMRSGSGKWYDYTCALMLPYICSKQGRRKASTLAPKTPPRYVPPGKTWGCPQGWSSFRYSCYAGFYASRGMSWYDARKFCQTKGAELVSVADQSENRRVFSIIPRKYRYDIWIGLNDFTKEGTFTWSDNSRVTYTNWARSNPDDVNNQDCVMMQYRNGRWNDVHCTRAAQKLLICEKDKAMLSVISDKQTDGCTQGSLGYGAKCYRIVSGQTFNFQEAEDYCTRGKGHLATINEKHVQAFLASYMFKFSKSAFWIGLFSNPSSSSTLTWKSGAPVTFTFWGKNHVGTETNTCIGMQTSIPKGLWNNYACNTRQMAICEYPRKGYTIAPTVATTISTATCPNDWVPKGDKCYKAFGSSDASDWLSWREARDKCGTFAQGGTLASITSQGISDFLYNNIKSTSLDMTNAYWIGLSDLDKEGGFKWTDGSAMLYTQWARGEPNDYTNSEDCVTADIPKRKWNDLNCNVASNYICQFQLGALVLTPQPTVSLGPKGGLCKDPKWTYFAKTKMCYYVSDNSTTSWFESRDKCLAMKSQLTSIKNGDENAFLTTLSTKNSINDFWIGMTDIDSGTHKWIDRTAAAYFSWAAREPNDYNGMERCVHMQNNGFWNDQNCNQQLGYICKKWPGQSWVPRITIPYGGCPTGYSTHRKASHCYQVHSYTGRGTSFNTAVRTCTALGTGGTLATISSQFDQDFISTLLVDIKQPVWIGLNNKADKKLYQWVADNTPAEYVNWMPHAPSGPRSKYDNPTKCVSMQVKHINFGKWLDESCYKSHSYVCQVPKNKNLVPKYIQDRSNCNNHYTYFGNSCYKLYTTSQFNWQQAEETCMNEHTHLASITSGPEAAFFNILTSSITSPMWLGLKFDNASQLFKWSDGWPVTYAPWAQQQPLHSLSDNTICVGIDKPNSTWSSYDCTSKFPFVCEINKGPVPTPGGGFLYGACPDNWIYYNYNCYFVEDKLRDSRAWASTECKGKGGQLASILTKDENLFRLSLSKSYGGFWIGLRKGLSTGLAWDDGSTVDYTAYPSYSNYDPDQGQMEECYMTYANSKYWAKTGCFNKNGYICKKKATGSTNTPGSTVVTMPPMTAAPTQGKTKTTTAAKPPVKPPVKTNPITSVTSKPPAIATTNGNIGVVVTDNIGVVVTDNAQKSISDDDSKSGLGGGAIAGIILGVMAVLAIVLVAIFFVRQGSAAKLMNRFRRTPTPTEMKGFDNVMYSNNDVAINNAN